MHILTIIVVAAQKHTSLFSMLVASLLVYLAACVAIPVEIGDAEPFENGRLSFIKIGESTKNDIAAKMSDYAIETDEGTQRVQMVPKKFRGGDWWLYDRARPETQWFVIVAAPSGGDVGTLGDVDLRFLLVKFDSDGIVTDYELSSSEGSGCNKQGVCVASGAYNLIATEKDDQAAKLFNRNGERCGVYLYGDHMTLVRLNDRQVGSLQQKKKFFFLWLLDPGVHTLTVEGTSIPESGKIYGGKSMDFRCTAGELLFIDIERVGGSFWIPNTEFNVAHIEESTGRREIGKRRLLLGPERLSD